MIKIRQELSDSSTRWILDMSWIWYTERLQYNIIKYIVTAYYTDNTLVKKYREKDL